MNDELENLIDRHTLSKVATAIAQICFEKAQHVQETWQDENLADDWDDAGDVFENAAMEVDPL